jgi:hypothetical protein
MCGSAFWEATVLDNLRFMPADTLSPIISNTNIFALGGLGTTAKEVEGSLERNFELASR